MSTVPPEDPAPAGQPDPYAPGAAGSYPPPPAEGAPYGTGQPGYGPAPTAYGAAPGYGPAPAGYGPPPATGTDGVSIAALVTGIVGLGIVPLILGIVGLNRVKKSGRSGRGLAIAGIVLGALGLVGWVILAFVIVAALSDPDVRDAIDDVANGVPTLAVGDCFDMPADATDFGDLESKDCGGEHLAEVVGTQNLTDSSYPGEDSAIATAEEFCRSAFEDYVGIDFDSSALDMGYGYPTDISWALGDRQIACYVATLDGSPLTATVQGTAQ